VTSDAETEQFTEPEQAAALAGDREAFAALCERHRERVWRIAASVAGGEEAEDLAQEAVVRAYAARRGFRGEAPFGAWLCRVALNVAHDYQRSGWRRRVTLVERCPPVEDGDSLHGEVERRELQRRVRRTVAGLPEKQRVPIWLHYFEGYSIAEVARLERTPEATVRSRVKAGLRRLSGALEDLMEDAAEPAAPLLAQRKECGA
jgi:RNA polymerase sigma-70 factor, ECF subfamily